MTSEKPSALYWVSTILVASILGCAGVLLLFRLDGSMKVIHHLGYPAYFATLLGLTRLMGAAALLLPVPKGLREWAYAGLTFDIIIVIFSILSSHIPAIAIVQPALVLIALQTSYLSWRKRARSFRLEHDADPR